MRKPKVQTRSYLDYQDLQKWLQEKDPDGWKKYGRNCVGRWADGGGFCNGCFVTLEHDMTDGDDSCWDAGDIWIAKILFEAYPEGTTKSGDQIDIWVWW